MMASPTKAAQIEAAWKAHAAWKVRRCINKARAEMAYMGAHLSGCDWCCGGGRETYGQLEHLVEELAAGRSLELADRDRPMFEFALPSLGLTNDERMRWAEDREYRLLPCRDKVGTRFENPYWNDAKEATR